MKIAEIIKTIKNLPGLSQDIKEEYLNKLNVAGIGNDQMGDILEELRDEIQSQMDLKFKEAGVEENFASEEYQKVLKEAEEKIASIKNDFNSKMDEVEKAATKLQIDTSKKIDEAQLQAVKNNL